MTTCLTLVGAGGTGCQYIHNAIRLISRAHRPDGVDVTIIDGDTVSGRSCPLGHPVDDRISDVLPDRCNVCDTALHDGLERQFTRLDIGMNKAFVLAHNLRTAFDGLGFEFEHKPTFMTTADEVHAHLTDKSYAKHLIALMVDNHETRALWDKAVEDRINRNPVKYHEAVLTAGNDTTSAEAALAMYETDAVRKIVSLRRLLPDITIPGAGLPGTGADRVRCGVDVAPTQSLMANTAAALAALDLTQRWAEATVSHGSLQRLAYNSVLFSLNPTGDYGYRRSLIVPHKVGL